MDMAYLHIVTNHIPIVGIPFALFVLLLGIWRRSDEMKAAAFLLFALLGAATLGVYLLGQGGEDFAEDIAGVAHDAIEDHEEMGLISLVSVAATALFASFGLIFYKGVSLFKRRKTDKLLNGEVEKDAKPFFPNWLTFSVLGLALLSAGILGYTGKLGGKIRHTEFYGGAAVNEENEQNSSRGADTETADPENEERGDSESGKGRGRGRGGR